MEELKTVEDWAKEFGTSQFHFAIAKAYGRWAVGQLLTKEEYAATIEAAKNVSYQ